jgi:hypothetical protein
VASERDDSYLRLKQSVDQWVAEVSQTRSVLSQSLDVEISGRPAFRLTSREPQAAPAASGTLPAVVPDDSGWSDLRRRLANTESRARETNDQLRRLESELDFAREQLRDQIRLRANAEEAWSRSERLQDETIQAFGRAQISLDELRRQMRGKEWALERAQNEIESLAQDQRSQPSIDPAAFGGDIDALRSRLETLTQELHAAREFAQREHDAAVAAESRNRQLKNRSERSRAIVEDLSKQIDDYAARLRETGRQLDEARAALSRPQSPAVQDPAPPADAQERIAELELALELSQGRADDLATALESAERVAVDAGNESVTAMEALRDDYDALCDSHMTLREEITALQERVIQRELEIARLKSALEPGPAPAAPVGDSRKRDLAAALDERSRAVELLEASAPGGRYLVQALWQELDAARTSVERNELDHTLLARALRRELECLRDLARDREFVLQHQTAQLDEWEKAEAVPESGFDSELLARELQLATSRVADRDATIRRLRGELAEAQERSAADRGEDIAEMQMSLERREVDLQRARERVEFLRKLLRESVAEREVVKQPETPEFRGNAGDSGSVSMKHPAPESETVPRSIPDIDVSQYQMNSRLQREVEQSLAFQSAWPAIIVFAALAGLAVLAGLAMALFLP